MEILSIFWGFGGKPRRHDKPASPTARPQTNPVQPQLYLMGNSPNIRPHPLHGGFLMRRLDVALNRTLFQISF